MAVHMSYAAVNAEANALAALANSGILRIYSGTRPTTCDDAITGTILAELTMNATAFGSASNGVLTANAITADSAADAGGTATHFRLFQSNGTTALWDGTVGTSGEDCNLNSVAISAGAQVSVTAMTHTVPRS